MQPVYAVQFEVQTPDGTAPEEVLGLVREAVEGWVGEWYRRWKSLEIEVPAEGENGTPVAGDSIDVAGGGATTGESWWKLLWTFPDKEDDNLFWQIQVLVARAGGMTEFTFILRLSSRRFEVKPAGVKVRPARVVRNLVAAFPCSLGTRRLLTTPVTLAAGDVAPFVKQTLLSPDRRLPAVVVSTDPDSGSPLADPGFLADQLTGLAEVYALADEAAADSLIDEVGRMYACFNGAVRIYWPGFHTPRDRGIHWVYKPDRVAEMQRSTRPVVDVIFDRLRFLSVMRIVEGPVSAQALRAVQEEARRKRSEELRTLKEKVETGAAEKGRVLAELEQAQEEREALLSRVAELEQEVEDLKRRWVEWSQHYGEQREEEAEAPEPSEEATVLSNVHDAVKRASEDFGGNLEFLQSAWDSAATCRYRQPDEVYGALETIHDLATLHFDQEKRGKIGPWEDFFRKRGHKFAMHESKTTMGLYGEERTFLYRGERITMEKHLKFGGGDTENSAQVFFEPHEESGKFLIGHCGAHLRYAGRRT